MGRQFNEHLGGYKFFVCIHCKTYLTNYQQLSCKDLIAGPGVVAHLFKNVVNIETAYEIEHKSMITGMHYVRDVYCKNCDLKLGWMYEMAENPDMLYKEGQVVLQMNRIKEETAKNDILAEHWDFEKKRVIPYPYASLDWEMLQGSGSVQSLNGSYLSDENR